MKSYFLCLRKKDSETSKAEAVILRSAACISIKRENCQSYNNAREFFLRLSEISSEASAVIMAVDREFFVNAKRMVCSLFSLKCAECEELARICNKDEDLETHCTMPENSAVFMTEDGLFSGFAVKKDNLHLIFLPLDNDRIPKCEKAVKRYISENFPCENSDDSSNDSGEYGSSTERAFFELDDLLSESRLKAFVSVSPGGKKVLNKFPKKETISFFTSELKRDGNSPKTYAALLAKEASERSGSNIGASITHAFKVEGDNQDKCFVVVAVANSENARVKKVCAEEDESVGALIFRAAGIAFEMLAKTLRNGLTAETASASSSETKKPHVKHRKFLIAGICAAVIAFLSIALSVGYFMARANSSSVPSNSEIVKNYDDTDDRHGEVALIPDTFVYEDVLDTQGDESASETSETQSGTENETSSEEEISATEGTSSTHPATEKPEPTTIKETATSPPVSDGTFLFTVYGYGHGVGMSQYGADYFAKQGWSYDKILTYYYTGTTVLDDPNMPETLKVNGKDVETNLAVAMVVQGEMGPSFHTEALKAQAAAAYTYAMRNAGSCDGLYAVSNPSQTVINAVNAVKGKYVSYNGTYINAVFFAYSGGSTVSSSSVWGSTVNYPYLVPVDSSSDLKLSNCKTQVRISASEMKKRAYDSYGVALTGDPSSWLKILSHDNSTGTGVGYVSQISMGGKVLSGNQFRTYVMDYDIRSHCFSVEFIPN